MLNEWCCEIEEGEKCTSMQNVEDVEEMFPVSTTFDKVGLMSEDMSLMPIKHEIHTI